MMGEKRELRSKIYTKRLYMLSPILNVQWHLYYEQSPLLFEFWHPVPIMVFQLPHGNMSLPFSPQKIVLWKKCMNVIQKAKGCEIVMQLGFGLLVNDNFSLLYHEKLLIISTFWFSFTNPFRQGWHFTRNLFSSNPIMILCFL